MPGKSETAELEVEIERLDKIHTAAVTACGNARRDLQNAQDRLARMKCKFRHLDIIEWDERRWNGTVSALWVKRAVIVRIKADGKGSNIATTLYARQIRKDGTLSKKVLRMWFFRNDETKYRKAGRMSEAEYKAKLPA